MTGRYPAKYPLKTERLVLRRLAKEDAETVAQYRNDTEVSKWQDWDLPYTLKMAEKLIGKSDWETIEQGFHNNIGIEIDGVLAGDLYCSLSEHGGVAEVGWTLKKELQGLGIAYEAASALIDDLILGHDVHRVSAQLSPENRPCISLLERLGFTRESFAPGSYWCRGVWDDNLVYALTDKDWKKRRKNLQD